MKISYCKFSDWRFENAETDSVVMYLKGKAVSAGGTAR